MILYIHGFASCGSGNKVTLLRQHFGDEQVLSPDLVVDPQVALQQLQAVLEANSVSLLIGSSLGGYYADWLSAQYHVPAVLINPSTVPFETLSEYLGENTNWCNGKSFEWTIENCRALKSIYRQTATKSLLVLLQTADEVLDYRLAEQRYKNCQVIVEQGGNHRFENLAHYLPIIDEFISASSHQKIQH